jgi:hypothetical protein
LLLFTHDWHGFVQEAIDLLSHLLSLIFSGHLLARLRFFD